VVERYIGWRSDDDDRRRTVEAQLVEDRVARFEVRQVVLLLEARVAAKLGGGAVAAQAPGWDRIRHDDRARQAAVDVVLNARPLVVEHRRRGNAEDRRGDRDVVGAVTDGDVEAATSRPARQLP
jgi:hypothetical protein